MKTCYSCKKKKKKINFSKDNSKKDKLCIYCKICKNEKNRETRRKSYKKNREKILCKKKIYYEEKKEIIIQKKHERRLKDNHLKSRANDAVYRAIKKGKIKRKPCIICGNPNSDAHHKDYNKKLDVIWLCRTHHMRIHSK